MPDFLTYRRKKKIILRLQEYTDPKTDNPEIKLFRKHHNSQYSNVKELINRIRRCILCYSGGKKDPKAFEVPSHPSNTI